MSASIVQIQTIINTTKTIGATVPDELTKAIARATKIKEDVYGIRSGRQDLAQATLAALDADRDPAADPEVQSIITRQALSDGVQAQVTNLLDADVVTALQANVDNLIESWQAPFDKAAADIVSAANRLGNIPLEAAADVLYKGGDAAEHWRIATAANRTIREILDAWATLATQTGFASLSRHHIVMRIAHPTLEQWETHELKERKLTAWEAHHLGLTLTLADRHSLPARIDSLAIQRDARNLSAMHRETGKGSGTAGVEYRINK